MYGVRRHTIIRPLFLLSESHPVHPNSVLMLLSYTKKKHVPWSEATPKETTITRDKSLQGKQCENSKEKEQEKQEKQEANKETFVKKREPRQKWTCSVLDLRVCYIHRTRWP